MFHVSLLFLVLYVIRLVTERPMCQEVTSVTLSYRTVSPSHVGSTQLFSIILKIEGLPKRLSGRR